MTSLLKCLPELWFPHVCNIYKQLLLNSGSFPSSFYVSESYSSGMSGKYFNPKAPQIVPLKANSHLTDNTALYMWVGWDSNKQNSLMAFRSWQYLPSSTSCFINSQLDSDFCLITLLTERIRQSVCMCVCCVNEMWEYCLCLQGEILPTNWSMGNYTHTYLLSYSCKDIALTIA